MTDHNWWKRGVFYQIYPRSFLDTSGNGLGDLNGITSKLDYIKSLGVEGIWISPFFKSPQKDYGYDVSDYLSVDPLFGSDQDFDILLEEAHKRDLKIVVDLVLSHTSNQHEWFLESRDSQDNAKADWYVWADPKPDGTPPNNWLSVFGGPAWAYYPKRGQYYLHQFLKEQPDLNFHNPEVQQAVLDIIHFWCKKGVDGFRFDALIHCFSDDKLRDNPPNTTGKSMTQFGGPDLYNMQLHENDRSLPEAADFTKRIRDILNQYPGVMGLGEICSEETHVDAAAYCGDEKLHTAYSFELLKIGLDKFNASSFKKAMEETAALDFFWPSWSFSNHDMIRSATRWSTEDCKDKHLLAKCLNAILLSLRGSPYIYQGEELGLIDVQIDYEDIQDPWGKFLWPEWQGRDGCRTPMPWKKDAAHAGFSSAEKTWLPIPQEHRDNAVDVQDKDQNSVLNLTRDLVHWRAQQEDLISGDIQFYDYGEDILVFRRGKTLCIFNLRENEAEINAPDGIKEDLRLFGIIRQSNRLVLPAFAFGFFRI